MDMRWRSLKRRGRAVWTPSLARQVVRSRWFSASVVLIAGVLVVTTVQSRVGEATAAREGWGASVTVAVVAEPVGAGQPVRDAIELVERPRAMVPEGAVDEVHELLEGAVAAVDLVPGEILLQGRLVGEGIGLRPAGTVAVTVSVDGVTALVEPGDLVDLWSTDVATLTSERVVTAVVVLDRSDDLLTIAVPEGAMDRVAVAALGPLTVAQR